jgi:hypothetical protein
MSWCLVGSEMCIRDSQQTEGSGDIIASEFEKFLQQSYGSNAGNANAGNSPAGNAQASTGSNSEEEGPRDGDEPEI